MKLEGWQRKIIAKIVAKKFDDGEVTFSSEQNQVNGRNIILVTAYFPRGWMHRFADASKFKTGDVVRFKSGGLQMTVGNILSDTFVRASWFVGDELVREVFHVTQLEKVA